MEWGESDLISTDKAPRGLAEKKRTGVSAGENPVTQGSSEVAIDDRGASCEAVR